MFKTFQQSLEMKFGSVDTSQYWGKYDVQTDGTLPVGSTTSFYAHPHVQHTYREYPELRPPCGNCFKIWGSPSQNLQATKTSANNLVGKQRISSRHPANTSWMHFPNLDPLQTFTPIDGTWLLFHWLHSLRYKAKQFTSFMRFCTSGTGLIAVRHTPWSLLASILLLLLQSIMALFSLLIDMN